MQHCRVLAQKDQTALGLEQYPTIADILHVWGENYRVAVNFVRHRTPMVTIADIGATESFYKQDR